MLQIEAKSTNHHCMENHRKKLIKAQYSIISQFDKMIAVGLASHNIVYLEFSRGCLDFEQNTDNMVEWTGDSRK